MIDMSIWLIIFVKPCRTLFFRDLLRSTDKLYFRVRISFIGHLFDTVHRYLLAVTRETFLCIFNLQPIHCISVLDQNQLFCINFYHSLNLNLIIYLVKIFKHASHNSRLQMFSQVKL